MELIQSETFKKWLATLKDVKAQEIIFKRLLRVQAGLLGDVKPVGEGISELRIHYAQGYRIYIKQQGNKFIILLCAGDKSSQDRDIVNAKRIALDY